jgi:hypothetical protein
MGTPTRPSLPGETAYSTHTRKRHYRPSWDLFCLAGAAHPD